VIDGLQGFYFGTVEEVVLPTDQKSASKYQTEYIVSVIVGDTFSSMEVRCIIIDEFGSPKDYNDKKLEPGYKVFVAFPRGDRTFGVILGGSRFFPTPQADAGRNAERRYREFTTTHADDGSYTMKSDAGPNLKIEKSKITIDDSNGDTIVFDKANRSLTVTAKDSTVTMKDPDGNPASMTINVDGLVTINAKTATVKIEGTATVTAKEASIDTSGDTKVKASGKVTVDGKTVELNGATGDILTTETQPFCFVSGIPFVGSTKVKAGP
jgi:hypothetical protein